MFAPAMRFWFDYRGARAIYSSRSASTGGISEARQAGM
jgi:hypothetical protein